MSHQIDVREGPNIHLSFDGFKLKSKIDSWQIDGFAVRPDFDNFGFFDNAPSHAVGFWGVYATRPSLSKTSVEVYHLGLDRRQATFERGTAQEVRHSLGARISRPLQRNGPDSILITKASGSSAPSAPGTSGHGRLRLKRAIDFRRFG